MHALADVIEQGCRTHRPFYLAAPKLPHLVVSPQGAVNRSFDRHFRGLGCQGNRIRGVE